MSALLEARGLVKDYPVQSGFWRRDSGWVRALDRVDLTVEAGRSVALVGESGSGKTTLARCLLRLIEPTAGSVRFRGRDLLALPREALRRERRHLQMVFQDPFGSLDPRMSVGESIAEPLVAHRLGSASERRGRVGELLGLVGLPADSAARYPHEFSGGQRQRIGIARALATQPDVVVADEPVSALDVSVRAQVLNLLGALQARFGLALMLISHDLAVVEQLADEVVVLYLGRVVESAPASDLFARPRHPYTVSLLSAVPRPVPKSGRRRIVLGGDLPAAGEAVGGCPFHPRCPIVQERCRTEAPALAEVSPGHQVSCHYPGELVL
jgi:oligopeptide/dipeptide ABC transporter ATP-binding protein